MLILFDIDDTLLDDTTATSEALDALYHQLGSGRPKDEFRQLWLASLNRHFARFLAGEIGFQEQRRARIRDLVRSDLSDSGADALFATYLREYERAWCPFGDVVPCLEALRRHRLGIVSDGSSHQQRQKLERLGIVDRFACVVVSEDVGCSKPDPRIFLRACELVGADPKQAIYVGDRLDVDAFGAAQAGLRAVWLNRAGSKPPADRDGFAVISTLGDLPMVVTQVEHALSRRHSG